MKNKLKIKIPYEGSSEMFGLSGGVKDESRSDESMEDIKSKKEME